MFYIKAGFVEVEHLMVRRHGVRLPVIVMELRAMVEAAGFPSISLTLEAEITPPAQEQWDVFLRTPGNPTIPTLEEVMPEVLTPEETAQLVSHLRPLVESGAGVRKSALAYLWATKQ